MDKVEEMEAKRLAMLEEIHAQRMDTLAKILWCTDNVLLDDMKLSGLLLDFLLPICEAGKPILDMITSTCTGLTNCEAEKLAMLQMIMTCKGLETKLLQSLGFSTELEKTYWVRVQNVLDTSSSVAAWDVIIIQYSIGNGLKKIGLNLSHIRSQVQKLGWNSGRTEELN